MTKFPKQMFSYTGGKARYAKHVLPLLRESHTYVEPFLGAGSVFCAVARTWPKTTRFVLNDANPDLMNLYRAIQVDPRAVIDEATTLQRERSRIWLTTRSGDRLKEHFYRVRDAYREGPSPGKMLFLGKTCYFGIWQPNGTTEATKGFNGATGDSSTGKREHEAPWVPELSQHAGKLLFLAYNAIGQPENIMAWHEALQRAELRCGDYSALVIPDGATVYMDPPYLGAGVCYSRENGRPWTQTLLDYSRDLGQRARVVMTNKHDPKGIFEGCGASISYFDAQHNTKWTSDAAGRKVKEIILVWDQR